jgi:Doubled CXXCH motif (Paired_CXXCH_1)
MKRLTLILAALMVAGAASVVVAGDYHTGLTLICTDCHVTHYSQSHGYNVDGTGNFVPLGAGGPFTSLLRDEEVKLCLACHNNQGWAPDVFGGNGGAAGNRLAGGLNIDVAHGSNEVGYNEAGGHTLHSTAVPPGGTGTAYVAGAEGLICSNCHAQHGSATQYRNLLSRGIFAGDTLTYAVGTNNLAKDVFERSAAAYTEADVDYNEPTTTNSFYGQWCQNCHVDFHGSGGAANMGGQSGGVTSAHVNPWKRHPVADVNIGTPGATHISSLARYAGRTNKVKVMDSQGLWLGTGGNTTVTPSCMSCHKAHGNRNSFGLIFMIGTGTVTEEGDGGVYKDLCRQCHSQGA